MAQSSAEMDVTIVDETSMQADQNQVIFEQTLSTGSVKVTQNRNVSLTGHASNIKVLEYILTWRLERNVAVLHFNLHCTEERLPKGVRRQLLKTRSSITPVLFGGQTLTEGLYLEPNERFIPNTYFQNEDGSPNLAGQFVDSMKVKKQLND